MESVCEVGAVCKISYCQPGGSVLGDLLNFTTPSANRDVKPLV